MSRLAAEVEQDESLPKMEASCDSRIGLEGEGKPAALLVRLFVLLALLEADCKEVLASCLSKSA